MKKVKFGFLAAAFVIAILAVIVFGRVGLNHVFAKMVDSGKYYILMEDMEDRDRYMNMEQKVLEMLPYDAYVMNYNLGNANYKNKDYSKAQIYYEKCLEFELPKQKECSVRINLTMTKIMQIDFNTVDTGYEAFKNDEEVDKEALIKKIDGVIDQLKADREILTEKNCAGAEDDNGHSKEAETLKKDIDDKIEELEKMKEEIQKKIDEEKQQNKDQDQNQQDQDKQNEQKNSDDKQNQDNKQDQNNNNSKPDDVDDDREDDIKEKMKEKEQDARQEREDDQKQSQKNKESQEYWDNYTYGSEGGQNDKGKERIW
ncbi:tetratricopeptide repeat protein [Butyrivibrio fibrisolvens]|uniref:tetratricopeptide repeat protein n=1 Tax=Butyrivibrio fibrisolvens TaxID=831 RepID=UPI00040C024D|nr:tetratricopeptide repeat protein [Butyrivibrio fibrisolvens]